MFEEIDTNLYSRQIGAIGIETMKKLSYLKILIINLRGLGIEIAKNIILAGPKRVSIFDSELVKTNDLGANFYLSKEDINKKRRDESCLKKLSELNTYVKCDIMEGIDILSQIKNYNILIITKILNKEQLYLLNEECRKNKVGFIYTLALGISGFCFVDFGEHLINDDNGEQRKSYIINNITKEGEIFIDNSSNKIFNISRGNSVIFREIKGLTELNDGKPRNIIKNNKFSFFISDKIKYENYISGGICEEIKAIKTIDYRPLKERFYIPYDINKNKPNPIDFSKIGRNELLHCGILALHEFYEKNNNSLPELNDPKMAKEILEIAKEIYNNAKHLKENWVGNIKNWEDKIILNLSNWAKSEISPICSFLGGIAAQEIIKFTGKYTPINQWLWFEFSEITENIPENADKSLKNCRYDDQIAIFGNEVQKKLSDLNIFMIGAGALGCEFLKNFALMGISNGKNKSVTVVDNDNVEFSNLNRQFLFRRKDLGKSKSFCACREIKKINEKLNCTDRQSRIEPDSENIYNEKFWLEQTYIINAVDNIEARKYIDSKCTFYEKPLIDSGTLGTLANIQTIIPHVTECYNDRKHSNINPLDSIPMCSLHNFPNTIEHCIEWGKELFNCYFNENITELKNWAKDHEYYYEKIKSEDSFTQLQKLNNIKKYALIIKSNNFDKCIELAVDKFNENFEHKIKQILFEYPEGSLNKDGSKFWSGAKRFPHSIKYDENDDLHFSFVKNFAIILARTLGIAPVNDDEYIKKLSKEIETPKFIPAKKEEKEKINTLISEDLNEIGELELMMENLLQGTEEKEIDSIKNEINSIQVDFNKINSEKYEKDNDKNGHIDFIFATSNIRARNYEIKEIEKLQLKLIAGRIVPALATTTAAITGIACLQIYTLIQTNKINFFRNCYFNFAINRFIITLPTKEIKHTDIEFDEDLGCPIKAIPLNWTVWDKIIIKGSKSINELIEFIYKKYNVKIFLIKTMNDITIFQSFLESDNTNNEKNKMLIEDIYAIEAKKKDIAIFENFLCLKIDGEFNEIPVQMPLFKYIFN